MHQKRAKNNLCTSTLFLLRDILLVLLIFCNFKQDPENLLSIRRLQCNTSFLIKNIESHFSKIVTWQKVKFKKLKIWINFIEVLEKITAFMSLIKTPLCQKWWDMLFTLPNAFCRFLQIVFQVFFFFIEFLNVHGIITHTFCFSRDWQYDNKLLTFSKNVS